MKRKKKTVRERIPDLFRFFGGKKKKIRRLPLLPLAGKEGKKEVKESQLKKGKGGENNHRPIPNQKS